MRFAIILALLTLTLTLDLPYQAHSFNDLDYFLQLLRKGVKIFKLDLSMVTKDSCVKHSSWNDSINTCSNIDKYSQEICCLGFRGDTSSTPDFKYDFNTSYEFVALLTRKDIMPYFKQSNIFIAINFQYKDSQNNLTKTFLYDLMRTINTSALNITIATGTDNIILDYDFKCVIQGQCKNDSIAKYISDSNIVLQSSSETPYHPHDVYKRYRNFNVYYKAVKKFCDEGFPTWVDKYPYPIIFWEPSNEQQIQYVSKTFLSDECLRPPKHNTIAHFAIASNLEPQMFQTYFQNYESDAGLGKKYLFTNASNPLLSKLDVNGKQYILLAFKSDEDGFSHIQRKATLQSKSIQIAMPFNITALSGHLDTFMINVQNATGSYTRLYNSEVQLQYEWTLPDKAVLSIYHGNLVRYITRVSDTFYNYITTPDGKSAQTSSCDLGFIPTSMVMQNLVYIVGQKAGQIWLSYNCTSTTLIGYGSSAAITSGNNGLHILLSDGMCQSAVYANNNEMNKCNFFKSAEFKELASVPKLINYVYGSIEKFNGIKNNTEPITGCNPILNAAKIANGMNPSLVVFNNDRIVTAYNYVPLNRQPLITTLFCGASNYDKIQTGNHFILSWLSIKSEGQSHLQIQV